MDYMRHIEMFGSCLSRASPTSVSLLYGIYLIVSNHKLYQGGDKGFRFQTIGDSILGGRDEVEGNRRLPRTTEESLKETCKHCNNDI